LGKESIEIVSLSGFTLKRSSLEPRMGRNGEKDLQKAIFC